MNLEDNNEVGGMIDFDVPQAQQSIIKVIGVGGGGGNAVNYMYKQGMHDVSFLLCNTDSQALSESPIPVRLQLGKSGLGAGNDPEKGRQAAEESIDDIREMLSDGTRMVFITAGMGGGTGTGAAPVVARVSKELGILTVGIVTIPFRFEGDPKILKALDGVEELSKNVDSLLIINNERLREIYAELDFFTAFARADDTLHMAARSISEIITEHTRVNVDFKDVCMVLKDGGVAIMSTGYGEGEGRVSKAIEDALTSPLLNNNDIFKSKKLLFKVVFPSNKSQGYSLAMEETNDINDFMAKFDPQQIETKFGFGIDDSLGQKVKITILASGFGISNVELVDDHIGKKKTQEQAMAEAEKKQKEKDNRDKIIDIYGNGRSGLPSKRHPHVFIFQMEDLDNDDVIYAVESTPTVSRSKSMLQEIHSIAHGDKEEAGLEAVVAASAQQKTISFA